MQYGFCFWHPKAVAMEAFRKELEANPQPFLELIRQTEAAVGQPITAETYKRPKPTENPDLQRFFAWKADISCIRTLEPGEAMFRRELAQEVSDFFEKLIPLYTYFQRFGE